MILWLASFPRSGNTLLRQMLNSCFGIRSYSKYNDSSDIASVPEVCERVGHLSYTGDWGDFYTAAGESAEMFYIKTHDGPPDSSRAIYVVRHPMSAAKSYMEYLNRIAGRQVDMIDCLCGTKSHFPSWGTHLDLWDPLNRPGTLLIKFENIVNQPEAELGRIEEFLGRARSAAWNNTFDSLQQTMPNFFRKGEAKRFEANPALSHLCRLLFGPWMEQLGYSETGTSASEAGWIEVLETVTQRYHAETRRLHEEVNLIAGNARECRRWAEKAEKRFCDQRDLAHKYMERARAAETLLSSLAGRGEIS